MDLPSLPPTSQPPARSWEWRVATYHQTVDNNPWIPDEVKRNLAPLRSAVEYAVSRSHELEISFFIGIR